MSTLNPNASKYRCIERTLRRHCNTIRHATINNKKQSRISTSKCTPHSSVTPTTAYDITTSTFTKLLSQSCPDALVKLKPSPNGGRGLFTLKNTHKDEILLQVPLDQCLIVDYSSGLRIPPGDWPRLRKGIEKDNSLNWDILLALALLDALAGNGNDFWTEYSNTILPQPLDVTLPFCLPESLLGELHHREIQNNALEQKERLKTLFPGLAVPLCENGPTFFEWAFACVRSRAFALGNDIFAFIPFLDVANHSIRPNANFQLQPPSKSIDLITLDAKGIESNTEILISYTGELGSTNQRLMAQYGFVPGQGNPFDRLSLDRLSLDQETSILLSLDTFQDALGDSMVDVFSGKHPYLYAALKSLPIAVEERDVSGVDAQKALIEDILSEITENIESEFMSTLKEDEELIHSVVNGSGKNVYDDGRIIALVRYRIERKKLVAAMKILLQRYLKCM